MRKYFLIGLLVSLMPNICLAYGPRYTQLVREKERKMAELEKCMGSTKGLKIAGVSTLGLTAAGVAGNIAEASAIKSYDKKIDKAKDDIKKAQKAVDEKDAELNNLKQQNQQPNQNQQGNAQASSANNPSNSECPEFANTPNVVKTEKKEDKCVITECAENFKPAENGQICVPAKDCGPIKLLYGDYCVDFCPDGTKEYMRVCQDEETAKHNLEFDKKVKECLKHGAAGYSEGKGCLCQNENTHQWDENKKQCVEKTDESENKKSEECHNKVAHEFINGIPSKYDTLYQNNLSALRNRTADADGTIDFVCTCNKTAVCEKGKNWSECKYAYDVLPDIARHYTKMHALNEECGETNDDTMQYLKIKPTTEQTKKDQKDCIKEVAQSFKNEIPDGYKTHYNELLGQLKSQTAEEAGFVNPVMNGITITCKKGQKFEKCENGKDGLAAIAKDYTMNYAKNDKCGTNHPTVPTLTIHPTKESEKSNRPEKAEDDIDCKKNVEYYAKQKWYFDVNSSEIGNEYELAVRNDIDVYNKYKAKVQEIYEKEKTEFDKHIIQEGETKQCDAYSVSYKKCPDKTYEACDKNYYICSLALVADAIQKQVGPQYINEMVEVICKNK